MTELHITRCGIVRFGLSQYLPLKGQTLEAWVLKWLDAGWALSAPNFGYVSQCKKVYSSLLPPCHLNLLLINSLR